MKLTQILTLAAAPLATALPLKTQLEQRQTPCASGVHIIVAGASNEPPGEGIIGPVASMVEARIPGSDSEAIVYPALLLPYVPSDDTGTTAMLGAISSYVGRCPSTKIVLMGYSQGAQVVADALGGTSEIGFAPTAPLASNLGPLSRSFQPPATRFLLTGTPTVSSVIIMGDPSHVVGQSYDVGTSSRDGLFPRLNLGPLNVYASRIQSYCDSGDPFCDAPNLNVAVHLGYVNEYGTAATDFVVSKAG